MTRNIHGIGAGSDSDSDNGDTQPLKPNAFSKSYHIARGEKRRFFSKSKAQQGKQEEIQHAKSIRYQQVRQSLSEHIRAIPQHLSKHVQAVATQELDSGFTEEALFETLKPFLASDSDLDYIWRHEKESLCKEFREALAEHLRNKTKPLLKQIHKLTTDLDSSSLLSSLSTFADRDISSLEEACQSASSFSLYCSQLTNRLSAQEKTGQHLVNVTLLQRIFTVYISFFCSPGETANGSVQHPFNLSVNSEESTTKAQPTTSALIAQMHQLFLLYIKLLLKNTQASQDKTRGAAQKALSHRVPSILKLIFPLQEQRQIAIQLEKMEVFNKPEYAEAIGLLRASMQQFAPTESTKNAGSVGDSEYSFSQLMNEDRRF